MTYMQQRFGRTRCLSPQGRTLRLRQKSPLKCEYFSPELGAVTSQKNCSPTFRRTNPKYHVLAAFKLKDKRIQQALKTMQGRITTVGTCSAFHGAGN